MCQCNYALISFRLSAPALDWQGTHSVSIARKAVNITGKNSRAVDLDFIYFQVFPHCVRCYFHIFFNYLLVEINFSLACSTDILTFVAAVSKHF